MSDIQYGKIRLEVPEALDGNTANISTVKGFSRDVTMHAPKTDVYLAGLEQYIVQGGKSDETVSLDFGEMKKVSISAREFLKKLPYDYTYTYGVIRKGNELNILVPDTNKHIKWNGTDWVNVSTFPYKWWGGGIVMSNGNIHVLGGGSSSTRKSHYRFNGTSWINTSTLPNDFINAAAVVVDGQIHIICEDDDTDYHWEHHKWTGSSWTRASLVPSDIRYMGWSRAVVWNNKIYVVSCVENNNKLYRIDLADSWYNSSWVVVSDLPINFSDGVAVAYNDGIYIFGGSGGTSASSTAYPKDMYKWDGTEWTKVGEIPTEYIDQYGSTLKGCGFSTWNSVESDEIVIVGGVRGSVRYVSQWDGKTWHVST